MASRRDVLTALAGLPLALSACSDDSAPPPPPGSTPPSNVLMITIDDLNDWVGFLGGHPQALTPNMDRLAARSRVFAAAQCNAPVCSPSRASVLTGNLPQRTGIYFNNDPWSAMLPGNVLMPNLFARNGYRTKLLGKIYHTFSTLPDPLPGTTPAANLQCSGAPSMPPQGLFDWAALDIPETSMPDYDTFIQARDFLAEPHTQPFFLATGFLRTHAPWYVPREFVEMFPLDSIVLPPAPADDLDDLPPSALATALTFNFHDCITKQGLWARAVQAYLASIAFVDRQVGHLLDALDASAHADNTIVVLWSDHGFHLGEKFHWHKLALWERSTHVPFTIALPGNAFSPGRCESVVSLVDLYPTLAELCGFTLGSTPDGRSLTPLLRDPAQAWDHPVLTTNNQTDHAVRDNRWRYIRYANGDAELYDRDDDPGELTNLASDPAKADVIARLAASLPT